MSTPNLHVVRRESNAFIARRAIAEKEARDAGRAPLTNQEVQRIDALTIFEVACGRVMIDNYEGWQKHLTWRSIFDCKLPLNLAGVCQRARDNGYRFASYAGEIYFVSSRGMIEATGLSAGEVGL